MADFTFLDIDPTMELLDQFPELKSLNYQSFSPFSTTDNNLFNNQAQNIPTINNRGEEDNNLPDFTHNSVPSVSQPIFRPGNEFHEETHKRKELDFAWETSFWNSSSPHVYETEINIRNNPGRGKRAKNNGKEEDKPKEVVHVRARRGQATNSHCVAERVRRGKINERLRSLQDIVPGCYRNMGMAVMLDEIINYVQFLQNQIEFLSMKLTAASACYDFNSDSDDMETMQVLKLIS
ncbi:hypothetical protein E1A91_A11G005900v1 [Gossypium mustelinum]|uniref:BHLH domain-containing protein n=1 Tax=Gossypium mustelinum TaxID=34275 RepID=A0A5D2X3Q1_GOSMU|nr:hypothetical protein E1A91_A11G005900v1 [Gossypium mustelinum]